MVFDSRYAYPVFPHEDDIVHVGPWDVGNMPIADWCTFSIDCQYEVSGETECRARSFVGVAFFGPESCLCIHRCNEKCSTAPSCYALDQNLFAKRLVVF